MIQNSTYTEGPAQVDGRRYVKERHLDNLGKVYEFEWLGSQDASLVLQARVQALNTQLVAQADALSLVADTRLPLTKLQFERRFTDLEWDAIQGFNTSYTIHPALTDVQKLSIKRGLAEYAVAQDISLTDSGTTSLVNLYETLGLLAAGRAVEVLA